MGTRALIIRDVPSRKLNYGFIQFESIEAAEKAYYEVHGQKLHSVTLHIEFSKSLPGERKKRLSSSQNHSKRDDERHRDLHWMSQRGRNRERRRRKSHSSSCSESSSMRYSSSSASRSRSRSRSRSKRHRHRSRHVKSSNIPITTTTTINNEHRHNNRHRDSYSYSSAKTMCVNLPIEFDLKRMSDLIGFDTKKRRYALFSIHSTSSSLSKLQSYSDKRSKEKKRRHRERTRRRDRKRKELERRDQRKENHISSRSRSRSNDGSHSVTRSVSMSPSRITNIENGKIENDLNGNVVMNDLKMDKQQNGCLKEEIKVNDVNNVVIDVQDDAKK